MRKTFAGARLRRLREDRGMAQADLARLLGISPSYLNQIEHDSRPLTVPVLVRITEAFGVDAGFFAEQDTTRLIAELREALADTELGVAMPPAEIADLAGQAPAAAQALVTLHRRYRQATEQLAALTGDRGPNAPAPMPHEEVRDFFHHRHNHVAALDDIAEAQATSLGLRRGEVRGVLVERLAWHGIRVATRDGDPDELHHFDVGARVLHLSSHLRPGQQAFRMATQLAYVEHDALLTDLADGGGLSGSQAKALARIGLANYFAAAFILPYGVFHAAAENFRYDVERLADHFGLGFETICHRLSTLQRPKARGVPFSLIRVDRAGNMSKRQSATGFHFSRAGGTCPLWNTYEAFAAPGKILTQIAVMPDGRRYFWIARTVTRTPGRYGTPGKTFAIGLGCELRHACRLVYSTGLDLNDQRAGVPIGPGCRTCDRATCPQRAFPQVGRPLLIHENRGTFAPYAVDR